MLGHRLVYKQLLLCVTQGNSAAL